MEENQMIKIQIENNNCIIVPYDSNLFKENFLVHNNNRSPFKLNISKSVSLTISSSDKEEEDKDKENIIKLNEYNKSDMEISFKSIFYSDKKMIHNEESEVNRKKFITNEIKSLKCTVNTLKNKKDEAAIKYIKNNNASKGENNKEEKMKESESESSLFNNDMAEIKLMKNKQKEKNENMKIKNPQKFIKKKLSNSHQFKNFYGKLKEKGINILTNNSSSNNFNNIIKQTKKSYSHRELSNKTTKPKVNNFLFTSNLIHHNSLSTSLLFKKNNNKLSSSSWAKKSKIINNNPLNIILKKMKGNCSRGKVIPINPPESKSDSRNIIEKRPLITSFNKDSSKQKLESNKVINNINNNYKKKIKKISIQTFSGVLKNNNMIISSHKKGITTSPNFGNSNNNFTMKKVIQCNGEEIKKARTINNFSKYIKTKKIVNAQELSKQKVLGRNIISGKKMGNDKK